LLKEFLEVRFHNINVFISSKINKQYKTSVRHLSLT